ncbi:MAG TPA: hypothetical protein ENI97_09005 [Gammaproteobacteria bacterium]|nr:hypothetical protein [Gammaproteobacteria bacterium]
MKAPVVLIGVGEMGGVFARGLLRVGHPVFPVTRDMHLAEVAQQAPDPEAVIVAVAEGDLHAVLQAVPAAWRERLVLLQNELLPADWEQHGLSPVTVISVWFEKKPGREFKVIIPSPVFGPHAGLIQDALARLGIAVRCLDSADDLLHELVSKNVYILTTNIAGLAVGGTVGELWAKHESLAREIANEVIDIQQWLTGQEFDRERLIHGMVQAFEGDLAHQCMGRSAPARLARAIALADEAGLAVPRMRKIAAQANAG